MTWRLIGVWAVLIAGAARAGERHGPPETLAETHPEAAGVRPFSPQYPLWSDGATKQRWVWLPRGKTIDAKDAEAWRFPIGTRFWKQFSFGGRKVETRYLEKTGRDAWVYATYVWSEDQRDATLVPPATGLKGAVEIAPGVRHDIPSVSDCRACHEGKGRDVVLGFGALQLSADRDPLAPQAEPVPAASLQLAELMQEKRLAHAPASWKSTPPAVAARTPRGRAALGYFHANCSFCHNDRDPVSSVGLSLRADLTTGADEQPAIRSAVGVPSKFQIRGVAPGRSQRLAAGDVERSAVLVRMQARDGISQMPPLGSKRVDTAALELISAWVVDELPAGGNGM